jgi:arginine decarboxylase
MRYPKTASQPPAPFRLLPQADQRRAPMVEAFRRYQSRGTTAFSTPGHKRGMATDDEVMELLGGRIFATDVWLNTAEHDAALHEAEALAAHAWGGERAFFLVNGSSCGNHALLLAHLGPDDEVIVARDAHTSLLTGLILTGAKPISVAPQIHPDLGISTGVTPADIAAALDAHPTARLVALTSPSYHGIAIDLPQIVEVAHERGVPVYVDEAWGAHFPFHPAFPTPAMAAGADAAVISIHKTLSSLSQGSMLLMQGDRLDEGRIMAAVRMMQTTSRLLPVLLSLDGARRQMALQGWALSELTLALAEQAKRRIRAIPGIDLLTADRLGLCHDRVDPTRLVIDVHQLGLTGYEAEAMLRNEFGIAPEMSDAVGIVCLITIGDSRESIEQLVNALTLISLRHGIQEPNSELGLSRSVGVAIAPGEMAMTPRDAFFSKKEALPLADAVGAIAAELIVPYPPGIPVVAPGERFSREKVEYLSEIALRGSICSGSADPHLGSVRVVGG